ncbi:MAG: hypothetical protein ACOYEV_04030 [Candidatus Nanopelagicales bacterium]
MNKISSYGYKALCQVGGIAAMVAGWWVSMLNISIDRYAGNDFFNFWTVLGLVLILLGALVPQFLISLHNRKLRQREIEAARLVTQAAAMPLDPPSAG